MAGPTFRSRRFEQALAQRPRLFGRKQGSRSKRSRRRWPGAVAWTLGLVAGLAALTGLAHLHGNPPDPDGSFPDPALATLAKPAVAAIAAFAALTLIAWCVRRLRLEFLAWWPGRIVVPAFAAPQDTPATRVEHLTALFRDRLGMSHLQSPAAVPAPAEQGDFLDVLARNGVDSGNPLGSLLSLVRAAFPAYAWEVNGALVTREGRRPFGVTVHVVRAPGKGGGGHTFWDTTWAGAAGQAADYATASILPRTRVCRSPWTAWRRYYMPAPLLRHYERAAELEHERRYDEALDAYYKALDLDPMNHGLRLQIGFLQEKLGLFIDALDTYESILEVAEPTSARDVVRRSYRRSARRDRDQNLLVARYRLAVLLGGPGLPHQWRKWHAGGRPTRRDEERERLRERLASPLRTMFERALKSPGVKREASAAYAEARREMPAADLCAGALSDPAHPTDEGDETRLPELFLLASLDRLAELRRMLPPSRPWGGRPPLTRAAVRVSMLVVKERLRLRLSEARCRPDIARLERDIASIEPSAGFDRWHEHYNVACMWSLPLLENCADGDVKRLTRLAVDRLECATERADTEFLVSRRDWLVSEDPDLRGLRAQPRFKSFEAAYFPSAARTPLRPRDVHRWEVSRYTLDLLQAAAQRWEEEWENRARDLEPVTGMRTLLRWYEDEMGARHLIRDVALHHRDWHTRFELLDRIRGWSVEYGFKPIEVPFPDFRADGEHGRGDVEAATAQQIADKDHRLADVVRELELADRATAGRDPARLRFSRLITARRSGQRGGFERGLPRDHVVRLCDLHANLWHRLGELVTPDAERTRAARQLAGALAQAAAACRSVTDQAGPGMRPAASQNGSAPRQAVPSG